MMKYNGHELEIRKSTYISGGNLALILFEEGQVYATLTTNLGRPLPENYAFVDPNNVPWVEDFIEEFQLGEPLGLSEVSGFCSYPLYRFDLSTIKGVDED